ncbi:hypothetical protein SISSUDRAFT_1045071 [Sistotremastrum suecicum HHB10207 ss-3]|uniref:MYND-type domain-containing protein n=1 Tax=Sistotremastrum suecicum HHB10207 ss-3 TaxID=1314776 RepID=A0A166EN00_9AGAM|nr:hypothetical protein SISSUDRAFT_1045071 [Sistotremastrum suecicum HHB10207 ss-3]
MALPSSLMNSRDVDDNEWIYADEMAENVSKKLNIAVFTPRDLKRIHKTNSGAEVVRKLVAFSHRRLPIQERIGLLIILRQITRDSILAQEAYKQKLDDFVFRCLNSFTGIRESTFELRRHALVALFEMTSSFPDVMVCHSVAIKGTAQLTRLIPKYSGPGDWHDGLWVLISIIATLLPPLSSYKDIHEHSLPSNALQSLELPNLADALVGLLSKLDDLSMPLKFDTVIMIFKCLIWIAYYDSNAILSLSDNRGLLLFVALALSPSLILRSTGFLGLLHLRHPDYSHYGHVGRICDPLSLYSGFLLPDVTPYVDEAAEWPETPRPKHGVLTKLVEEHGVVKHAPTPHTLLYFQGYPLYASCPASVLADLEIDGPSDAFQSYDFVYKTFFGSAKIDDNTWYAMVDSLRDRPHDQFRADVLHFSILMRKLEEEKRAARDPEKIYQLYTRARILAHKGLEQWPDRAYFYYAMIKGHSGMHNFDLVVKGLLCPDVSKHLQHLMMHEGRLNLFSMGVLRLSLSVQKHPVDLGLGDLETLEEDIAEDIERSESGFTERKMSIVLRFVTERLTGSKGSDSATRKLWLEEAKSALVALKKAKSTSCLELRAAVNDFITFQQKAPKKWGPLLKTLGSFKEIIEEAHQIAQLRAKPAERKSHRTNNLNDEPAIEIPRLGYAVPEAIQSRMQAKIGAVDPATLPHCTWCDHPSLGLKKCARCGIAKYCDKECQQYHWKTGHKAECVSPEIAV